MSDVSTVQAKFAPTEIQNGRGEGKKESEALTKTLESTWGKGAKVDGAANAAGMSGDGKQPTDIQKILGKGVNNQSGDSLKQILMHNPLNFDKTPSPEEVKDAKERMDKLINPLVSDGDKKLMSQMQGAILDGNPAALSDAVKQFAGNPEKLKAFAAEMQKNLDKENTGAHVVASDGHLTVYKDGASSAVEINPDGSTRVRAIETKSDGTVVAQPGEVLNKTADDVMKEVGNHAVNEIEYPMAFLGKPYDDRHSGPPGRDPIDPMPGLPGPGKPDYPIIKDPGFQIPPDRDPIIKDPGFQIPPDRDPIIKNPGFQIPPDKPVPHRIDDPGFDPPKGRQKPRWEDQCRRKLNSLKVPGGTGISLL